MESRGIKGVLLLALTLLMVTGMDAIAQRGRGMGRMGGLEQVCPNIPNLTEEQSRQIMDLRTAHLREMQAYRDQIDVNRTQYRALMRGDRADMAAINANIDERTSIRSRMEKKQAEHHQAIRSVLTEEQRVWFDAAPRGGPGFRQAGPGGWPGRAGMRQAAPYGGRGGRGFICPRGTRGFRRGF